MLTIKEKHKISKEEDGFSCEGTKGNEGVKRRLAIMTAQYVNIVFDLSLIHI